MTFDSLLETHRVPYGSWYRNRLGRYHSRRYSRITAKATFVLDHRVTIEILLLRIFLYRNQDIGLLATRRSKIGPVILGKRDLH